MKFRQILLCVFASGFPENDGEHVPSGQDHVSAADEEGHVGRGEGAGEEEA